MTLPFQADNDAMIEAVIAGDQAECERLFAKDDALKNATDRVRKRRKHIKHLNRQGRGVYVALVVGGREE
jgi:hypothetical protein